MNWTEAIASAGAFIFGFVSGYRFACTRAKQAAAQSLKTSAEKLAVAQQRTSDEVKKYNSSTPVADGNKLLSGGD